jgi:GT2 family glycosyltransferase
MCPDQDYSAAVSVIVPTIGRPESLRRLLDSLCFQTVKVHEVIVADGSATDETAAVIADACWQKAVLTAKRIAVHPPNAVRQRQAAIAASTGEYLLLLDDDVVLEPDCVKEMLKVIQGDGGAMGVFADFNNQTWPIPPRIWRFLLRWAWGVEEGEWQGRVIGPLLRFGYNPPPDQPKPMEWLGTCNTMIRRAAYEQVGGFSNFFLHRCTMNEDVDLGIKLNRVGRILFCPAARMAHHHAPGGRALPQVVAEDDVYNRFLILHRTLGKSKLRSLGLVVLYCAVETLSNLLGCFRRRQWAGFRAGLLGCARALAQVVLKPL